MHERFVMLQTTRGLGRMSYEQRPALRAQEHARETAEFKAAGESNPYKMRCQGWPVMLARTALCAGLLLPIASNAEQKPTIPVADRDVYIEVHGLDISWNGKPLGRSLSLDAKCKSLRGQMVGMQFTVASGIDTSQFEVRRIVKILKGACGAQYVAYDILVRLSR